MYATGSGPSLYYKFNFILLKRLYFFLFTTYMSLSDNKSGTSNGQAFSAENNSLWPDTSEVTQLLDNQFTVLQHLEGQVEFYKVW